MYFEINEVIRLCSVNGWWIGELICGVLVYDGYYFFLSFWLEGKDFFNSCKYRNVIIICGIKFVLYMYV